MQLDSRCLTFAAFISVQCHLWGVGNVADAEASAVMLQERGIMRVACLADGSAWALVQPEQLACLQASARPCLPHV